MNIFYVARCINAWFWLLSTIVMFATILAIAAALALAWRIFCWPTRAIQWATRTEWEKS